MQASIFLATPAFGGAVQVAYLESILKLSQLCNANDIELHPHFLTNNAIITEARNDLATAFVNSPASHLLFIDADIGFSPKIISKGLECNTDILCHPYPRKEVSWQQVMLNKNTESVEYLKRAGLTYHVFFPQGKLQVKDGLTQILRGPTGCMLIKREVFEKIMTQMPELRYQRVTTIDGQAQQVERWGFFDLAEDENGQRLGEDYAFCDRATKAGCTIMADISVDISHIGNMEFRGRLLDRVTVS